MKQGNTSLRSALFLGLIACLIYGLGAGLRASIGILLEPIADMTGLSYEEVSFSIAVMQIVFGASQPLFGLLAARWSNRFVLTSGVFFMVLSVLGIKLCTSYGMLIVTLGVLMGLGTGAIAFGLVLSSAISFVGQERSLFLAGLLNASAGMVNFFLAPLLNFSLQHGGVPSTMPRLALIMVLLIPCIRYLTKKDSTIKGGTDVPRLGLGEIQSALGERTYQLLLAGFSTCGFHMVIIESHLFSQFVSYGIPKMEASWAFSFYGIATIAGALLSGYASSRLRKGGLLSFYYGFRALWVLFYLFVLPKTMTTAILFATGLGLTGDATVSPTSGILSGHFPLHQVATLMGLLFFAHQIGGFLSAYLGGLSYQLFGNYTRIWLIDIILCLVASLASYLIREK